ncbi:MAG: DUF952 domain-containing protein [Anaerolineae bacterium]|nr:DUF952 domain-containing protein [Anaerolineae bacterium]
MIYHITTPAAWQAAQAAGAYTADSLASEGFIHCSTREQVPGTANLYFSGHTGLILLVIDESRLQARLVYENTSGGEVPFPHIYGPLNLDAVARVLAFPPQADGRFVFPQEG